MTPAELLALADRATPGPWEVGTYEIFSPASKERMKRIAFTHEWMNEADARLIALAPDLARLVAEMGEALALVDECADALTEDGYAYLVVDVRVALAKLSELETQA